MSVQYDPFAPLAGRGLKPNQQRINDPIFNFRPARGARIETDRLLKGCL